VILIWTVRILRAHDHEVSGAFGPRYIEPEPIMVDLEVIAIDMPSSAKWIERRGARQGFRR
jgi:hypothetical protein